MIREPGYIYIYLSNEETENPAEVFFDDFSVEHIKGPIVQVDEYYPFGLGFNSYQRENTVDQKYKFQGQEHIDELELGWDSFKWRNHMADIGRFFNVDPLSEKYYYNSPFAFSENKVVSHVELEGLEAEYYLKKEVEKAGNAITSIPGAIADGASRVKSAIGNRMTEIGTGIKSAFNSLSPGSDRGGFVLTGTGMASNPLPDVRGRVEDNSLVDLDVSILDVPGFNVIGKSTFLGKMGELVSAADNAGDLRDAAEGSGIGVWAPKEESTVTLENVETESGANVPLQVKEVTDTTELPNFIYYHIKTVSGKDSAVQTPNPKRESPSKNEQK